ncbi:ABC transporter permease [uncultured Lactobacillus sp.]|uniref:ABC transporter permease n=1 Tax=uncultured Lactobacillus sp. TaxID=153152 RepID=UPI0025CD966C|nr:ABC transporter permease [uncultured Lactobacillus sp.]
MRDLAKKRLQENLRQSLKYLVLVFNDFFILALIFIFGALMFWYAQAMKTMPENLWYYRPLVGILLWLPLLIGKLVTLLKPADLQFLLPEDENLASYLQPMLNYSLIVPTICLALIAGIIFPFATIKAKIEPLDYVFAVFAVFLAKVMQLKIMEYNLFFNRKISISILNIFLLLLFILGMFKPKSMIFIAGLLLIIVIIFILKPQHAALFDWQFAIEQEEKRKNVVYNAFSMFTDVKERQTNIKRRKYLDFLLPQNLARENPNKFLYRRSVLRNPENINLVVRMTAFAILISWLVQNWLWALGLSCLVVFLTIYQLVPMVDEFDTNVMYRVYPIARTKRGLDLVSALTGIMLVQWLIISISWLITLPISLHLFEAMGILVIFSWVVLRLYLPAKVKKRKL